MYNTQLEYFSTHLVAQATEIISLIRAGAKSYLCLFPMGSHHEFNYIYLQHKEVVEIRKNGFKCILDAFFKKKYILVLG